MLSSKWFDCKAFSLHGETGAGEKTRAELETCLQKQQAASQLLRAAFSVPSRLVHPPRTTFNRPLASGYAWGLSPYPLCLRGRSLCSIPGLLRKPGAWRGEQLESFKPGHGIKEMALWRSRTQRPLRAGPLAALDEASSGSAQLSLGTPSLELLHRPADLSRGFTVLLGMKRFPQHPA